MSYEIQITFHQCPNYSGDGDFINEAINFFRQAGYENVDAFTVGKTYNNREAYEGSSTIKDDEKLANRFHKGMNLARIYVREFTIRHIEDGKEIRSTDFPYDSECP